MIILHPKDDGEMPGPDLHPGTANNWLADSGWTATNGVASTQVIDNASQWVDIDPVPDVQPDPAVQSPPTQGKIGDGLIRWEEYRGFVVQGAHRRTDPQRKDLFASSALEWMMEDILLGYGATNLPKVGVWVHHVRGEDDMLPMEYVLSLGSI